MKHIAAIDISLTCNGWKWVCPDAEHLARDAAGVALIDGIAATGFTSLTRVELAITSRWLVKRTSRLNRSVTTSAI